mmetsp:Transcript_33741/g.86524  ORF Transcript_33741/g.86524 Transcript_33741/m.86524 type:complete len:130 (-) Transcript_33741:1003-1392(-)
MGLLSFVKDALSQTAAYLGLRNEDEEEKDRRKREGIQDKTFSRRTAVNSRQLPAISSSQCGGVQGMGGATKRLHFDEDGDIAHSFYEETRDGMVEKHVAGSTQNFVEVVGGDACLEAVSPIVLSKLRRK